MHSWHTRSFRHGAIHRISSNNPKEKHSSMLSMDGVIVSDYRADTISAMLDLPLSFGGRGALPHREQAFKWHYAYAGPRYQVIVMDTRTHRLYRSPSAFPGLLSPHGLIAQVAAAIREDVDVT